MRPVLDLGISVRGNLGPPVVAVVVLDGSVLAEELLELADDELGLVGVVTVGVGLALEPGAKALTVGGVGPLEVCGLLLNHHAHVRGALNVGLAAKSCHAAAGDADVAEEQLQDGHGAGVLGAVGVLRLAKGVQDDAGLAAGTGLRIGGVDGLELLKRHAAGAGDSLHVVAAVVLLELLVDAHLVAEGRILLGDGEHRRGELGNLGVELVAGPLVGAALRGVPLDLFGSLIVPRMVVVLLGLLVPTAEQTSLDVELELGVEQVGGVGVVEEVLEVVCIE